MDNTKEIDWNRIHLNHCPKCDKELKFRLAGSRNSIRSRKGADTVEDMYFCFKCDFQITGSKLMLLKSKKPKNIPEVFRTGFLSY